MSEQISISDFGLFSNVIQQAARVVDSAVLIINESGLQIYGAIGTYARSEFTSNAIYSSNQVSVPIESLTTFGKILQTIQDIHENDFTDFKFIIDLPHIKFSSKKFKTKYQTCNEDIISKFVASKVTTEMKSIFDFTTTNDLIRRVCSHTYLFKDTQSLRVYLNVNNDEMEHNTVFSTLGNTDSNIGNMITVKFGVVTYGNLNDKTLVLDLPRLNLFNAIKSDSINISLTDKNCLICKTTVNGKNNSFFNSTIYCSILKK